MPRNWKMRNRGGCQAIGTSHRLSSVSYRSCIYEFFRCVDCQRRSLGICFNTRHQFIEEACAATSCCRLISSSVTKKRKRYQQLWVTSCKADVLLICSAFCDDWSAELQFDLLDDLDTFSDVSKHANCIGVGWCRVGMVAATYLLQWATRIHSKRPGQGALGGRWSSICCVSVGRCDQKCKWKAPRDHSFRSHLCQSLSVELN